jgi:hypothetical protein
MSKKVSKFIVGFIIFICLISFATMKHMPQSIDVFGLLLTITTIVFINRKLFEEKE